MSLLKRFGCGCVGVQVGNAQIIFERCFGDDEYPALEIRSSGDYIKPEHFPGKNITNEEQERVFDEINRLMNLGRRFETLQRILGLEVKR